MPRPEDHEARARRLDPIALLAAVDEGAGEPYRTELARRLEAMRRNREAQHATR